ncbi:MAG: U32 family peptidase [Kiritimatiellae bacterium]|nr:U32 family peptidase [Kiritimatiellia bacterium]
MTGQPPQPVPIELLAPAGDEEALRAAIANGADAVYLGTGRFNARLRAENFEGSRLEEAVALCHRHNVRLYLTLNTLILPNEWDEAVRLAEVAAHSGIDAVIVQDIGLADWIHRRIPSLPLHASTQMTLSEPEAINWAQEELGIARVILPRELSTEEIRQIRGQTSVELEVFVHGALCISYSGQCHASFYMGGRSANRGACAQPCRLPYTLCENGEPLETPGRHILSPKDFCGLNFVQERIKAGVTCFKIEGRLKKADYVAATVAAYRDAIQAAVRDQGVSTERHRQALEILFARGQTAGYVHGDEHAELVDSRLVGHQGLFLGTLARVGARSVILEAAKDLLFPPQPGDGLAFDYPDTEGRRSGARIYQARLLPTDNRGGEVYELGFGREDVDLSTLRPGMTVWKTSDPALDHVVRRSYAKITTPHPVHLDFTLFAEAGRPLRLYGRDASGHEAEVESQHVPEPARTRPLTHEVLAEQLGRLGNTPYAAGVITLAGGTGPVQQVELMIPKSVLNELRRQLVERLMEQRLHAERHIVLPEEPLSESRTPDAKMPVLKWLVRSGEQLEALIDHAARMKTPLGIYLELPGGKAVRDALVRVREAGLPVGLTSPRVITEPQAHIIEEQAALEPDFYLARTWGAFRRMRRLHPASVITGDFSLNLAHAAAAKKALRCGLSALTPALELDEEAQALLACQTGAGCWEWLVYHHPTLFFTQYCLYAHHIGTGRASPGCGEPCGSHELTLEDRKGVRYQALRDRVGRIQIIRNEPESAMVRLEADAFRGAAAFRIELLQETYDQTVDLAGEAVDRLYSLKGEQPE